MLLPPHAKLSWYLLVLLFFFGKAREKKRGEYNNQSDEMVLSQ